MALVGREQAESSTVRPINATRLIKARGKILAVSAQS
jgi:hypothetical protein